MVNPDFYNYIKSLSEDPNFKNVLNLSDRQCDEKFDMELVCRYLVGKNTPLDDFKNINDINEFINERMVYFAQNKSFDKAKEENDFKQLFTLLASLNIHPFAKYIEGKKAFMGMFLISTYEVIAIGLGSFIDKYSSADSTCIIDKIKTMWSDEEFLRASGTGKSAKTRMAQCIGIGLRMFKK